MNKGRRGLHGPDDNPLWTQGIASVRAGDIQGSRAPGDGREERASTRADKTWYVACLSEERDGLTNLYLTLLLFLLRLTAISFQHGIAIIFPNRHLPINNRVPIYLALPCHLRSALILPELLQKGRVPRHRNRYCTLQGA
jgi:hypothetical protein